jgi:hypothetical protein
LINHSLRSIEQYVVVIAATSPDNGQLIANASRLSNFHSKLQKLFDNIMNILILNLPALKYARGWAFNFSWMIAWKPE